MSQDASQATNSSPAIESPRAFFRRRNPGYFSDSAALTHVSVNRSLLEYQLETLTSRGQEGDFELFARKLAEAEICPNLIPHTGPSGGGDSKVDSETFPVSDQLALAWYVGNAREAARDRWAFAFSAKKDWRSKVASDVSKIAGTGRGYTKAFFVTSRFVPDKERAAIEDDLRGTYALDVRILDRSWILDRVFSGSHETLAVELLHIDVDLKPSVRVGPADAARSQQIAELDDAIRVGVRESRVGPNLVQDAIDAACLAREVERPRDEVEGRFDRAEELAKQAGFRQQRVEVAYQRAWTAYWWFEDYEAFTDRLTRYEALVRGTDNVYDIERLSNLYSCAATAARRGWLSRSPSWLAARRRRLNRELARFEARTTSPSASLTAQALRLMLTLTTEPGSASRVFTEMESVIERAEGLIGFDLNVLANVLAELGAVIVHSEAFEGLYDRVVSEVQRRSGELAGADLIAQRAVQLHKAGLYRDTIAVAGRALPLLYRHESREQLVRLLGLIGEAYARLGLLWAARGSWLLAANVVGNEWHATGAGLWQLLAATERIRWLELELGRLPQALASHRLYAGMRGALAATDSTAGEAYGERDADFDTQVGHAILNLGASALRSLTRAPDLLQALGLFHSSAALLYALGHTDQLPGEMTSALDDVDAYLSSWRDMDGGIRADESSLYERQTGLVLNSIVLGMRISVIHDRGSPAVEIAESLLGALEGLFATGLAHGVAAVEPSTKIFVRAGDSSKWPFSIEGREVLGAPEWELAFATFDPSTLDAGRQADLKEAIRDGVMRIAARCFHFADSVADVAEQLFGEERALDRSLNFTGSFVVASNVLGSDSVTGLAALHRGDEREYRYRRSKAFSELPRAPRSRGDLGQGSERRGDPTAPDLAMVRHDEMRVASVIRLPLWDRAGWSGIGYVVPEGRPPLMALLFQGATAAQEIWKGWEREFGALDHAETIRVSIVRKIRAEEPHAYKVIIAPRLDQDESRRSGVVFMLARIHEMTPSNDTNLRTFLEAFEAAGEYFLGVGELPPGSSNIREASIFGAIRKANLVVVDADQVKPSDLEHIAVGGTWLPTADD
ncbi:MAG TPA: hypothetical protein VEX62_11050 [Candidatus Limnocylindrales bacterium]|nr:hypothetical protein [Candidatus Limnocylindrales bacterium]